MSPAEYDARIEGVIRSLESSLGKGSVIRSNGDALKCESIPTGIISIDRITGIGGIPRGRITEIYGPESSGKSTLSLHVIAEAQKLGLIGAYIDAEHAIDPEYAEQLGVEMDDLLLSQPDSGEQALEIVEALVRTGEVGLIVIDSVAALVPLAELEGKMDQFTVGSQARLMSKAMRKLTGVTAKSNCALIFLNQLREKVGVSWGNPETTPGGKALKFYASLRIDMRRGQAIDKDQTQEGFTCKVKIVKNKLAPPYKQAEVPLLYGKGFDSLTSSLNEAISQGTIAKTGSWYSYLGEKFQGMAALKDYLNGNPQIREELENGLRLAL